MNIEEVRDYALTLSGVTEDQPYGPDWLVFRIEGKIFLHLRLDVADTTCAIKLEPDFGQELREHYDGVQPAFHMNKTHWNDLYISALPDDKVKAWIHHSYTLVRNALPKKLRMKYEHKDTLQND